jgi:hypothetical protein
MDKYKLSPKGLRSLFNKLAEAGLLKFLDAKDVVNDVLSGEGEEALQKKYGLSSKGLDLLYRELEQSGLVLPSGAQTGDRQKVTINVHNIAEDIKAGMSSAELVEKYGLTERGFQWICIQLVGDGILGCDEIYEELFHSDGSLAIEAVRADERLPIVTDAQVYEMGNPDNQGAIQDISAKGLRISGLQAQVDEIKTLMIPKDNYGEFGKMVFEAKCRWTKTGPNGLILAGFEVINISSGMLEEFKLFFQTSTGSKD